MGRVLAAAVVSMLASVGTVSANPYGIRPGAVPRAFPQAARKSKGGGCGGRLGSNVYSCTVTPESGSKFTDCLRFASPGEVSDKFDLVSDQLGSTLGCTCKAAGSQRKPKFNGAPTFVCSGGDEVSFEGSVSHNGKSISAGFVANAAGASFVFSCRLNAACAIQ